VATIRLTVNGEARSVETEPQRPLLEVLREDLQLTGTKYGCGEGQCRACTVLLDGRAVTSCLTPVSGAAGKRIVTIEGLAVNGELHPVQQAFLDAQAMQCGYCVPGMILTTAALLQRNPQPSDEEAEEALNGNLCRCCGYTNILAAVRLAAARGRPAEGTETQANADAN
jgi:aerobic-type carbon monoxide dehydrogenase small subunit (CoxS/CutS family)